METKIKNTHAVNRNEEENKYFVVCILTSPYLRLLNIVFCEYKHVTSQQQVGTPDERGQYGTDYIGSSPQRSRAILLYPRQACSMQSEVSIRG